VDLGGEFEWGRVLVLTRRTFPPVKSLKMSIGLDGGNREQGVILWCH